MSLDKRDVERLFECVYCPFHTECIAAVEIPEDYPDGTCKTRAEFEKKQMTRKEK